MSFAIEQKEGKFFLSGFLDENSDLKVLLGLSGKLVFNFKGISRVNSCGVREWVNVLQSLKTAEIAYEECPLVVVKQINAVPDFHGKASVSSFFAPYFCESCDKDTVALVKSGDIKDGKAPPTNCPACGKPMVFDGIPGQYFQFLKRA